MIPGAPLTLGGQQYTVPPINLRIDFDYKDAIATLCRPEGEVDFSSYVQAASNVLFALMQRNYPEMSRDQFNDLIDLPLLRPIMNGMLQISGYVARPLDLATVASESLPPEPASSDSSTPPPDGSLTTSSNA